MYTYASGLERDSPRFASPGDFFVYVAFLWAMITVSWLQSSFLLPLALHHCSFFSQEKRMAQCLCTSHFCPPSQRLAEAVPGREEDYPCISCNSIIRIQSIRVACGVGMVGEPYNNSQACQNTCASGGPGALHTPI